MYFRMFLQMGITLYSTRIVLSVLGVNDFGIYNVIGGVIGMLGFFRSSMSIATQRYMNYSMGKHDPIGVRNVFSASVIGHLFLIIITIIIAETIGLWFVKNKLVISGASIDDVIFVYQTVIVSFIINLFIVPYNSAILAYEKMSFFAILSISEVILKLILIVILSYTDYDKLRLYAFLMMGVSAIVGIIYIYYCSMRFPACKLKWIWDKILYKKIFTFSGWILLGDFSFFSSTQGINILMNLYFGPVLNAARAISEQVNQAINSFSSNFMLAVRPSIIKNYAENEIEKSFKLVFMSTKFSFYLLLILAIPILYNIDIILSVWLENVPQHAIIFTQLIIVNLLIHSVTTPLSFIIQADGDIVQHQIAVSIGFWIIVIGTWIFYKLGMSAIYAYYITIAISVVDIPVRLLILKNIIKFPYKKYSLSVLVPILKTGILSFFLCFLLRHIIYNGDIVGAIIYSIGCIGLVLPIIYYFGMNKEERGYVVRYIYGKIHSM